MTSLKELVKLICNDLAGVYVEKDGRGICILWNVTEVANEYFGEKPFRLYPLKFEIASAWEYREISSSQLPEYLKRVNIKETEFEIQFGKGILKVDELRKVYACVLTHGGNKLIMLC